MASTGEIDENLEIYIGKRCQVKANNQRGLVVGVIKNAGRAQIEVELDGEGMSYGTYISKLFIEDEKYAKENKFGIWSMNFQMPFDYRKSLNNK